MKTLLITQYLSAWLLLCPYVMLSALFFIFAESAFMNPTLLGITLFCIPLCYVRQIGGWLFSIALIGSSLFYDYLHLPAITPLHWMIALSTLLALLIIALSSQEAKELLNVQQASSELHRHNITQLEQELESTEQQRETCISQLENQLYLTQAEVNRLNENEKSLLKRIKEKDCEIKNSKEAFLTWRGQADALIEKAERYQTESQSQLKALLETQETMRTQIKQSSQALQEATTIAATQDRERRRIQGMHKQLIEQFTEKSHALDEARTELFHVSEELENVQHKRIEQRLYAFSKEDREQIDHILQLEKSLEVMQEKYENEIKELQALVKVLMDEGVNYVIT